MKQFYDGGRKRELDGLENLYTKDEFTFAAVYGRKRIGKTSLIGEFISRGGKKAIRFTAAENTDAENLKAFSKEVFKVYPQTEQSGAFNNWNAAFNYAARKADGEKLILAIDEFPYAAKANADLLNALKKAIDGVFRSSKIMLIISGSNTNFMENRVFGRESPLCGKFTTKYELTPLDYYDSAEFFGNADAQDKLLGYAAAGGIPAYLNVIAKAYTVEDGIESAYFSKDGFFYEEPQNFLKEELREPALYNAILSEIAKNAAKLNAISAKLDEDNSKILKYIKSLIKLDAVEKEIPLGNDSPRSGTYRIKDNMFRFWYRFVQDERTSIENGEEQIYRKKIKPIIPNYLEDVFGDVSIQYLKRMNEKGKLPFQFEKIGKQKNIAAAAFNKTQAIIGECKWQDKKIGAETFVKLKEKAAFFADKEIFYYIFSKSGFTDELKNEAKTDGKLTLIRLEDLFN